MNYANTQEYVPRAKRNNRPIQERVQLNCYRLHYTHLPRILVKYMLSQASKKLNCFPAKHDMLKHYSPRMILNKKTDFDRHCKYILGEYTQAHEDEKI